MINIVKDTDDRRRPNMKTGGANQWLSLTAGLSVLVINYLTLHIKNMINLVIHILYI